MEHSTLLLLLFVGFIVRVVGAAGGSGAAVVFGRILEFAVKDLDATVAVRVELLDFYYGPAVGGGEGGGEGGAWGWAGGSGGLGSAEAMAVKGIGLMGVRAGRGG